MTKDMVSIDNAVWNMIALIQISCGRIIFSVESIRTEHNIWLKFCTLLLKFIDIPYIFIPISNPTRNFLLKMAKVNIYVHHNIKLHVKAQAHYFSNWLNSFTRDRIINYIYNVTVFLFIMSGSKCWNTIIYSHIHIFYSEGKLTLSKNNETDKHNNKYLDVVYLWIHSLFNY